MVLRLLVYAVSTVVGLQILNDLSYTVLTFRKKHHMLPAHLRPSLAEVLQRRFGQRIHA